MNLFNENIEKVFTKFMNYGIINSYLNGVNSVSSIIIVITILNLILSSFFNINIIKDYNLFSYLAIFYLVLITNDYSSYLENNKNYSFNRIELIVLNSIVFLGTYNILKLDFVYLGINSIFFVTIMVFLVSNLYVKILNTKDINIDFIPSGVTTFFKDLLAMTIVVLSSVILLLIIKYTLFYKFGVFIKLFDFLNIFLSSIFGIVLVLFLICLLWINGLHGASNITGLISPFLMYNLYQNILGANNVLAGDMINAYIFVGGSGSTFALSFILYKFCKSEYLKDLGKNSISASLFNTNEPIIFGIPIIKNKKLAVPFFMAPIVSAIIVFFATKFNLVRPVTVLIPWPTPIGIGAFISSGGDFRSLILALVCVVISGLIYYPFIKQIDAEV